METVNSLGEQAGKTRAQHRLHKPERYAKKDSTDAVHGD